MSIVGNVVRAASENFLENVKMVIRGMTLSRKMRMTSVAIRLDGEQPWKTRKISFLL
jgi:hypothetical protein